MPGFDGTGPVGVGPLTGRRRGRCSSDTTLKRAFCGALSISRRSGIRGYGRGHRWQYLATGLPRWARTSSTIMLSQAAERAASQAALEREATVLEAELNDLKVRLESLKLEERDDSDEVNGDATLERSQ
ncbi:MAG: DUF5320 domain-containing protein [Halobacteriota archaeon]